MYRKWATFCLSGLLLAGCTVHRDMLVKPMPPDQDEDGILDSADQCPAEMETPNGYKDADGCPDAIPPKPSIRSVHYDVNGSNVAVESKETLEEVARILNQYPSLMVRIEGHTDSYGTAAYNLQISKLRAETVKKWLVRKQNIDPTRLSTEGYGMSQPVASFDTKEGRIANRRIDFVIVGGWPPKE